jgi:hypothetical protein
MFKAISATLALMLILSRVDQMSGTRTLIGQYPGKQKCFTSYPIYKILKVDLS